MTCNLTSVEQILPPLIVRAAHQPHDMAAGMEIEGARFAHQLHSRFRRRLVALVAIAEMAAGDEIFPRGCASARARDHVVQRQFARRKNSQAILAGIAVANKNVLSRECAALVRDAAVLEQPDHRGQPHGDTRRVKKMSVLFFGHGHALQYKHERAPGRADVNRLIRSVQDENWREQ